MDWLPTLLAAAGGAPDPAYPPDGQNLLPVLTGQRAPAERTLFWRYKANAQRAVRSGNWKYLRINGNEFLFDVAVDQRERANLAQRHPDVFAQLKAVGNVEQGHVADHRRRPHARRQRQGAGRPLRSSAMAVPD